MLLCVTALVTVIELLTVLFIALGELRNILLHREQYSEAEAVLIQELETRNLCEPVDESSLFESKSPFNRTTHDISGVLNICLVCHFSFAFL